MFKGRLRSTALASSLLCAVAQPPRAAEPAQRVALVLSESAYPDADRPLKSPMPDARLVAEALTRRGFAVQTGADAGGAAMADAVRRFLDTIGPGSIAVVYFSGIGIQVAGTNYLVPVDARIWSEADVLRAGTSIDALVRSMADRGAKGEALILDASRRNPFERRFRSVSAGLAAMKALPGALTLASAAPGALVEEDAGRDAGEGVFAAQLAKAIGTSGLDAEQAFLLCRDEVTARTQSQQVPSVVSGLDVPFSFDPDGAAKTAPAASPPAAPPPAAPPPTPSVSLPAPPPAAQASVEPAPSPAPVAKAEAPPGPAPAPPQARPPAPPRTPPQASVPAPPPPAAAAPAPPLASAAPPPAPAAPAAVAAPASGPAPAAPAKLAALPPKDEAAPAAEAPAETPLSPAEKTRRAELDRRIGRNPRDGDALFERGRLLAQHGSYTLALLDFDRAISLAPNDADAFNDRCWTRSMVGQLQTAMDDCDRALGLRPDFADAHDSRGLVQLKRGSAEAAIVDYDAAIRIDPKQSSALYGRGIAELRIGRREAAEKDISDALALDPGIEAEYARYGLR